jgi:hypothetical protein
MFSQVLLLLLLLMLFRWFPGSNNACCPNLYSCQCLDLCLICWKVFFVNTGAAAAGRAEQVQEAQCCGHSAGHPVIVLNEYVH